MKDEQIQIALIRAACGFSVFLFSGVLSSSAEAYLQDQKLETALRNGEPQALSRLPAKGYKNGVAGFFKDYDLYVVPGTERAWCNDKAHGVLPPGCYIEFHFQQHGRDAWTTDGMPCGLLGRWQRPVGLNAYKPTAGAYYSLAIENGDYDKVVLAFDDRPLPSDLQRLRQIRECDGPATPVGPRSKSR